MEKISERYHVEVNHDGPSTHGVTPTHQLSEGVVYTPLIPNMPLHPNVMQITGQQVYEAPIKFNSISFLTTCFSPLSQAPGFLKCMHRCEIPQVMNNSQGNQLLLFLVNPDSSLSNHCIIHVACFNFISE